MSDTIKLHIHCDYKHDEPTVAYCGKLQTGDLIANISEALRGVQYGDKITLCPKCKQTVINWLDNDIL